jgi:hypothetical protein
MKEKETKKEKGKRERDKILFTFNTTVQPAANAGPNFQACISKGKFLK